jgi:hypothetical protein
MSLYSNAQKHADPFISILIDNLNFNISIDNCENLRSVNDIKLERPLAV